MTTTARPYSLRRIQQMLGLPRTIIEGLIGEGFIAPTRGARNELLFSFQDVALLRTAYELRAAQIPRAKILRALKRLRVALPAELPLSGLRITAIGNDIAVRERGQHRAVESGQLFLDFEMAPSGGTVALLVPLPPEQRGDAEGAQEQHEDSAASTALPGIGPAQAFFRRGEALEGDDDSAAEAAYRQALRVEPDHAHALLNLGALLCDSQRCDEALALYDRAVQAWPNDALLHFNRAIALEDLQRLPLALEAYARCLDIDPGMTDAHFNSARVHETLGHAQLALRHFSAYRRLQR